jgi:hypothetical protein
MDTIYKALFGKIEKPKKKSKTKSKSRSKTEEDEGPCCDNCGRTDCTRAQYDPWGPCDHYGAKKKKYKKSKKKKPKKPKKKKPKKYTKRK